MTRLLLVLYRSSGCSRWATSFTGYRVKDIPRGNSEVGRLGACHTSNAAVRGVYARVVPNLAISYRTLQTNAIFTMTC